MTTPDERDPASRREARWFAYLLGDATPEERAKAEAEMRDDPKGAAHFRRLFDEVSQWATQDVPGEELDLAGPAFADTAGVPASDVAHPGRASRRQPWRGVAWAAGLAAAALFGFALSQVGLSVRLGARTVYLGKSADAIARLERIDTELATLATAIEETRLSATKAKSHVTALARQHVALQEEFGRTAAELAWRQRLESERRYRDVENVLRLTGIEPGRGELWLASNNGSDDEVKEDPKAADRHVEPE